MIADAINGCFDGSGAIFLAINTWALYRDKIVKGVHPLPLAFFGTWGLWNLYYYPTLGQWLSFSGGVALVTVNLFNLWLMIYYMRHPGGSDAK